MYFKCRKATTAIVATSLIIVVAVVAVLGFQNWYGSFSSKVLTNAEYKSNEDTNIAINSVIGNELYVTYDGEKNLTIQGIKIGNKTCLEGANLSKGINTFDISSCTNNINSNVADLVLITDKKILEKQFLLKNINVTSSNSLEVTSTIFPKTIWAKSASGDDIEYIESLVIDSSNNIITTGLFDSATLDFGDGNTLSNTGNSDVFIAKYDNDGNISWLKSITGTGNDLASSITVDNSNNIYITGRHSNNLDLGSGVTITESAASYDAFVAKYDSDGTPQWAKNTAGDGVAWGHNIVVDTNNNIFVAGQFDGTTIDFGSGNTLTNTGSEDVFIAKYDNNGNILWVKSANGNGQDHYDSSCIDSANNIYAIGFSGSGTFNLGGGNIIAGTGTNDGIIVKYDNDGNVLWNKSIANTGGERIYSCITDNANNVYIMGNSYGSPSLDFGDGIILNLPDSGFTKPKLYLAKYDSTGKALWAKFAAGENLAEIGGLALDNSNNIYATGYFAGTILDFGDSKNLTGIGGYDNKIFVAKYSQTGNLISIKGSTGTGSDYSKSIAIDNTNNIFIGGNYGSPEMGFGDGINLTNTGIQDIFLTKYS